VNTLPLVTNTFLYSRVPYDVLNEKLRKNMASPDQAKRDKW